MAPVVVGQSATHIGTVINTIIASFLAKGSVSYLYYADRLIEFPSACSASRSRPRCCPHSRSRRRGATSRRSARRCPSRSASRRSSACRPRWACSSCRSRSSACSTSGGASARPRPPAPPPPSRCTRWGSWASSTAKILGAGLLRARRHANAGQGVGLRDGLQLHGRPAPGASARARRPRPRHRRQPPRSTRSPWPSSSAAGDCRGSPIPGARRAWLRNAGVSAGLCLLLGAVSRLAPPPAGRFAEAAWLAAMIVGSTAAYVALSRGARRGGSAARVERARGAAGGGVPCAARRGVDILARDRTTCGPCCSA